MKRIMILVLWCGSVFAARDPETTHVFEGNLALPASQQPSPLFCFGQEVIDKGDAQIFGYTDFLYGNQDFVAEVTPSIFYGVTKNFTLSLNIPVAAQLKAFGAQSSGIEDMWLQGEFAFYNRDRRRSVVQATLVTTLFFPTGSSKKNPPTGLGNPSVFLGVTCSYMSVDWNAFIAPGGYFSKDTSGRGDGNKFFYQAGFGRNIAYRSKSWLLMAMFEMYGMVKSGMDGAKSIRGPSFDDNAFYLGPSLWFSTRRWIVQAGIMFPAYQKKMVPPSKNYFFTALSIGYTL